MTRVLLAMALTAGSARAEWTVAAYLGGSHTADSNVIVSQPDGEHLFRGVSWESRSFASPPYYGVQVADYFAAAGRFGIRLDFFHDKVYAAGDALLPVLQRFSLSHGLNYLMADAALRQTWGLFDAYAGIGAGTVIPHVEAESQRGTTDAYQWFRGVAGKAFAGAVLRLGSRLGAFVELRASIARVRVSVPDGEVKASLFTQHAIAGALARF